MTIYEKLPNTQKSIAYMAGYLPADHCTLLSTGRLFTDVTYSSKNVYTYSYSRTYSGVPDSPFLYPLIQ
jgi:hypothetical protein